MSKKPSPGKKNVPWWPRENRWEDRILLKMKGRSEPIDEPLISLLCGVPALICGFGVSILMLSYLIWSPIGPPDFYEVIQIPYEGVTASGNPYPALAPRIVPSPGLLGTLLLWVAICSVAIFAIRQYWPRRRVNFAAAGLLMCLFAFALGWLLILISAFF